VARHGAAAAEQAAILDVETKKITGAEGLKSLGWRGNEAKKAAEKVCSLPTPRAFTFVGYFIFGRCRSSRHHL
jgi:hypothetical protein